MSLTDDAKAALERAEAIDTPLSVKEYADLFRFTERAVYMAIKDGHLPYPIVRPTGKSARILVPSALVSRLRAA